MKVGLVFMNGVGHDSRNKNVLLKRFSKPFPRAYNGAASTYDITYKVTKPSKPRTSRLFVYQTIISMICLLQRAMTDEY